MSLFYAFMLGAGFGSLFTLMFFKFRGMKELKLKEPTPEQRERMRKFNEAQGIFVKPEVTQVSTATCECGQVKYLKKIGLNKRESWVHYANQFVCKWTTRLPLEG